MNLRQLFEKLEGLNQTEENYTILRDIVSKYITNDISFNFANGNVDLNEHLTPTEIEEIEEKYYIA